MNSYGGERGLQFRLECFQLGWGQKRNTVPFVMSGFLETLFALYLFLHI